MFGIAGVIIDKFGLMFRSENDNFQARIAAEPQLTADRKLVLPDENGTLATREYVAQNAGGSGISAAYLAASEDRTNTTTFTTLTGMTVVLEANSLYRVDFGVSLLSGATALNSKLKLYTSAGDVTFIMPVNGTLIPNTNDIGATGNAQASTTAFFDNLDEIEITWADDSTARHLWAGRIITTGAQAVTLELQFAQIASSATFERCADAVLIATKLAAL